MTQELTIKNNNKKNGFFKNKMRTENKRTLKKMKIYLMLNKLRNLIECKIKLRFRRGMLEDDFL
jgi:hypothetical protein